MRFVRIAIAGEAVTGTPALMNPLSGHFHINIRLLRALDMVALAESVKIAYDKERVEQGKLAGLKLKAIHHEIKKKKKKSNNNDPNYQVHVVKIKCCKGCK